MRDDGYSNIVTQSLHEYSSRPFILKYLFHREPPYPAQGRGCPSLITTVVEQGRHSSCFKVSLTAISSP